MGCDYCTQCGKFENDLVNHNGMCWCQSCLYGSTKIITPNHDGKELAWEYAHSILQQIRNGYDPQITFMATMTEQTNKPD